jgi:hypothetical protein
LIVDRTSFHRGVESSVIALYVHAPHGGALISEVADIEATIQGGVLPDLPIICYVDQRDVDWEAILPHLDGKRHWISPQCYRDPGETFTRFSGRIYEAVMDILDWSFNVIPTWHAYDRNGQGTVAEAVETFRLYEELRAGLIGILPFTDMRQGSGTGGMNFHPSIKAEVAKLDRMQPEDRPNRYSYWQPRSIDMAQVLRNKLGQDRELVQLSNGEKHLILSLLSGGQPPPVQPPTQPPSNDETVERMRRIALGLEGGVPNPVVGGGREFCEALARAHGGVEWGLHQRPNGRVSADIVALNTTPYRIFDVIVDHDGADNNTHRTWAEVPQSHIEPGSVFVRIN